jgi:hypothetical protein
VLLVMLRVRGAIGEALALNGRLRCALRQDHRSRPPTGRPARSSLTDRCELPLRGAACFGAAAASGFLAPAAQSGWPSYSKPTASIAPAADTSDLSGQLSLARASRLHDRIQHLMTHDAHIEARMI